MENETAGEFVVELKSDFNEAEVYRHSVPVTIVIVCAYTAILVIGVVGNSLVVVVVLRSPRMRTVTNLFILNLAVADLLVILFCLPPTLLSNILVREYLLVLS
ncbi:unnamed protein product [Allacma fusca]|uniref:G-protein coupled receptors family 1 profile domain-containing protein n=1 Tax=Allacma fusca TaxID=39272 RepID=A0A8J2Q620_9HEXA|nr:unnamed protein product [Allacma fusca]